MILVRGVFHTNFSVAISKIAEVILIIKLYSGWSDVSWNNHNLATTPYMKFLVEKSGTFLRQVWSHQRNKYFFHL